MVLLIPVANLPMSVDSGGKYAAGPIEIGRILPLVSLILYWWCTWTCECLRKFFKKCEMTQMLFSEAWGKMIHEKNLKQKNS